jgi:uncharacterized membrane protein
MKTRRIAGGAAVAFGVLTLVSGGLVLLGTIEMGAFVPFVLWFNFFAGFAYIGGGLLLVVDHRLAFPVALIILIATAAVFAAFGWRALNGGAYEMRTVGAMTLRTLFWAVMAWIGAAGFRGKGD